MKLAISYVVGLVNLLFVIWGLYKALPVLSVSVIQAITQAAVIVVPFGSVAIYAFRGRPLWVWNTAFVVNLLSLVAALVMGVLGSLKSEYVAFQSLAFFVGIFPLLNLVFLLYRAPKKTVPSAGTEVAAQGQ